MEFQLQHHPSNEYSGFIFFRIDWLDFLLSKGLSRVSYNTTVQKHQFFGIQPSLQSISHIHAASSVGKESSCNAGDPGSIPGLGRSAREGIRLPTPVFLGFPCVSAGKESACNMGDLGSIPGLGRSSGEGKGYPLQYPGLENSMDCIVLEVTKSQARLSNFHYINMHIFKYEITYICFLI